MIKRNQRLIRVLNYLSDSILIFVSYFAAVHLKYITINGWQETWKANSSFVIAIIIYSFTLPSAYYAFRVYAQSRFKDEAGEYLTIILVNFFGTLFVAAFFYLLRITEFSRVALFLFWLISSVLVVAKHILGRRLIAQFRILGYNKRHVIIDIPDYIIQ